MYFWKLFYHFRSWLGFLINNWLPTHRKTGKVIVGMELMPLPLSTGTLMKREFTENLLFFICGWWGTNYLTLCWLLVRKSSTFTPVPGRVCICIYYFLCLSPFQFLGTTVTFETCMFITDTLHSSCASGISEDWCSPRFYSSRVYCPFKKGRNKQTNS